MSAYTFRPVPLLDRGSQIGPGTTHRCNWVLAGPIVVELWRWWLRLGVSVGKWYVAVYLGPIVLSFGLRRWRPKRERYAITWSRP